ncbi:MAG: DNA polymerase III subunit beta [Beijerinckiaceae bacterium]
MRFQAERTDLLSAIKRACGVVPSRTALPVLSHVLIDGTDTGVKVSASSLDEWITVDARAAVFEPGSVCIPAQQLLAWLTAAAKGALIEFCMEGYRAIMRAGAATVSFATLPPSNFPVILPRDTPTEVEGAIPAMMLCLPYVSEEEVRYFLNGVAISYGHAVGMNGHIGCFVDIGAAEGVSVIVPTSAVRQIIQCGPNARLFVGQNMWACEDEGVLLGGKLIDGVFPDWRGFMPAGGTDVLVDADAVIEAVSIVQIASGDRARAIVIKGDGERMNISCRGDAMEASTIASYEGDEFETCFNSKYAHAGMATFVGSAVSMAVNGYSPCLVTSTAKPDVRVILTPMRA